MGPLDVPDCGALVADAAAVVSLDGERVASDTGRFPFPRCGLHRVRVEVGGRGFEAFVALGPGVVLGLRDGLVVTSAVAGPACLQLDPPTFGWSCDGATVPPSGPFELRPGARILSAEAKNQPPLYATLLVAQPGRYTASANSGAVVVTWEPSACR